MPSTTTTNMGLIVPTPGQEPGPNWANDLNADLGILDQHNHSTGQGVPITPSGMNISSNLPFNGNSITLLKTVNFQAQSGSLSGVAPNLGCIYVAGNELYYNDEAGNVVPITLNGSVNAGAGSISGLPSGTASASYSGGSFVWRSATNTPANTDTGSVVLRNIAANSKGLTLSPPNSMAADYGVALPTLPGATSFMQMDTSGNMSASIAVAGGISTSNIADGAITGPKLANAFIGSVGASQVFTSSGTYSVPAGVDHLYVIAAGGGGGGGGGGKGASATGGGGGAGSTVWRGIIPVTASNTYTVTIGAGGSSGGGGSGGSGGVGSAGGSGGATSFDVILSVPGGSGGGGGNGSGSQGGGAAGRGQAGDRGQDGASGAGGGASYLSSGWDGTGGTGATNGSSSQGGGGGGSVGAGGAGGTGNANGVSAAANSGAGGGGGQGSGGAGNGTNGGAGGSGYLAIYIV